MLDFSTDSINLPSSPSSSSSSNFLLPKTVQDVLDYAAQNKRPPVYLKYFWKVLLVVAVFYGLPSVQFVVNQYVEGEVTCYFNFKCADHRLGVYAFNNSMLVGPPLLY